MSIEGGARGVAEALCSLLRDSDYAAYLHRDEGETAVRWWIGPQAEWPQFSRSQFYVAAESDGLLWCGLGWEKGLDPSARGYIASSTLFMDEPWDWERIWGAVVDGRLMSALMPQLPATFDLRFGNGLVPGFDPQTTPMKHRLQWILEQEAMRLAKPVFETGYAARVVQAKTLSEVFQRLSDLPEWRWLWVSCFLGWTVDAPNRPSEGSALLQNRLWPQLSALLPWYGAIG